MAEVVPFLVRKKFLEIKSLAFTEKIGDSFFSGMTEWRIPEVMGQTAGADDGTDFFQNIRIFNG